MGHCRKPAALWREASRGSSLGKAKRNVETGSLKTAWSTKTPSCWQRDRDGVQPLTCPADRRWLAERECNRCWCPTGDVLQRPQRRAETITLIPRVGSIRLSQKRKKTTCRDEGGGSCGGKQRTKKKNRVPGFVICIKGGAPCGKKSHRSADSVPQTGGTTRRGFRGDAGGCGSSLAGLHVGRDGAPSRQALEALVGVVDEDPVLVLQVGLTVVGHRR